MKQLSTNQLIFLSDSLNQIRANL